MDNLSAEQRHYNMSRIRGEDTKPEILVRKYLFSRGLRFRKNDKRLPGHPDIVLPKYKTVILINGCFWHGHEGCKYFKLPETNRSFWEAKINRNRARDKETNDELLKKGWKVIIIWECELKPSVLMNTLDQLYSDIKSDYRL